ncbi:putative isomerase YbhE [Mycena floridula]|nr:putative isomerase YbhE [Mycena floridula]
MVNFTVFLGGYTSYILSYIFDTDASTLTFLANTTTGASPSWITPNLKNPRIFYATNEIADGAVQSFQILPGGQLQVLDTVSSGGNGPAFAAQLSSGAVAVMNYGGANGKVIPMIDYETKFATSAPVITFPAPAGGVSNPHMVLEHRDELFNMRSTDSSRTPTGSGPRHIAIIDDIFYTVHETASTLTSQKIPSYPNGTSEFISNVSVAPTDGPADGAWFAAELLAPPKSTASRIQYLYATNRNIANRTPSGDHDPRGDPIAIFEASADGALTLVKQVYTGLEELRGVEFGAVGSGAEEYLVATGAQSGGVAVYKRVDGGADLELVVRDDTVVPRSTVLLL